MLNKGLVAVGSDSNSGCLEKFLLKFVELGFRITLGFESLFRVRFKVEVILYSCAGSSSLNFVGSWIFIEA